MSLVKTSLLNGIAVVVKLAGALVLNKILAIFVGPAGYAIIGQFQNIVAIIVNIAGGVLATGVTKATAQHFDDEARQHFVWKTAFRLSIVASLIAGLILLFVGNTLSSWLLKRADMSSVFVTLALSLPAMTANNLLLAIVNGKKNVGIYVASNIVGSILGVTVTGALALNYGLYGALIAFTINPAITLVATGFLLRRSTWCKINHLWGAIDKESVRELLSFGLMGLTTALVVPVSHMLIRDYLAEKLSWADAGYWQAVWKISDIYLLLITSTLSVYYLPRIAEIREALDLKNEIVKAYRFLLPLSVIGASTIFLSRDFIIKILFTPDFSPIRELFVWQLVGDIIKISSWMLGYVVVGRAMAKVFILKEIGMGVLFVLLTRIFVDKVGLQGVTIAYLLMYLVNWLLLINIVRLEMRKMAIESCSL